MLRANATMLSDQIVQYEHQIETLEQQIEHDRVRTENDGLQGLLRASNTKEALEKIILAMFDDGACEETS